MLVSRIGPDSRTTAPSSIVTVRGNDTADACITSEASAASITRPTNEIICPGALITTDVPLLSVIILSDTSAVASVIVRVAALSTVRNRQLGIYRNSEAIAEDLVADDAPAELQLCRSRLRRYHASDVDARQSQRPLSLQI